MNEELPDLDLEQDEWLDEHGFDALDTFVMVTTVGFSVVVVIGILVGVAYLIDGAVQWALA